MSQSLHAVSGQRHDKQCSLSRLLCYSFHISQDDPEDAKTISKGERVN